MERIRVDQLAVFSARLEALDTNTWLRKTEPFTSEECKELLAKIGELVRIGKDVGDVEIPSTISQLRRIRDELSANPPTLHYPHSWHLFRSLQERFYDDLSRCNFISVAHRDAELWNGGQLFGAKVFEAFPSATVDIEEAGKCLALERGTAAVFHLMRAMEVGLKATANALGVAYAPSWESYLRQMKPLIEAEWTKKPLKWRREEPFFKDVYNHLYAVKLSWRNPTMHIVQTYSPEMAHDVWGAVRAFMRHLATKLSEKKTAKPRKDALV